MFQKYLLYVKIYKIKFFKTNRNRSLNMKKLNLSGYVLTLLFPIMLFLSYKGEQTLSYLIMLFFLLSMLFKKNRERFKSLIDGGMASGLLFFIVFPFVISIFSGGIVSRVDSIHYLYWIIFFPLVF